MNKLYYTISEVAQLLDENVSTVRFWSNSFEKYLKPHRNAKGNRMFVDRDIEVLRRIKFLTRDQGMSLDAASRALSQRDDDVDKVLKIRESLLKIRERLVQIRQTL